MYGVAKYSEKKEATGSLGEGIRWIEENKKLLSFNLWCDQKPNEFQL